MKNTMTTTKTWKSLAAVALLAVVLGQAWTAAAMTADGEAVVVQIIASAGVTDTDQDGLSDAVEATLGTNPAKADSDNDSMGDAWEVWNGLDPMDSTDAQGDGDEDGLTNVEELAAGSSPNLSDTDGDGFWDAFEATRGTDPASAESRPTTIKFGDVNCDGATNAQDVQIIISAILGMQVGVPTDVDANLTTNALDLQSVINAVLGL